MISASPSPHICCAVCNKVVDRVTWWRDVRTMTTVIQVQCHGETDCMQISEATLFDLGAEGRRQLETTEGLAFTTPRITVAGAPGA